MDQRAHIRVLMDICMDNTLCLLLDVQDTDDVKTALDALETHIKNEISLITRELRTIRRGQILTNFDKRLLPTKTTARWLNASRPAWHLRNCLQIILEDYILNYGLFLLLKKGSSLLIAPKFLSQLQHAS
eukprot:TCALIF_06277-PA protein Name:"Protein of unknown function" AED:0.37 eAED:0.76 QI:0/0/0/1/1/1/2/0/129